MSHKNILKQYIRIMTERELLQMRDLAEAGTVQFKERANDRYDIGCEMVAFSNYCGWQLAISVDGKDITNAANEFVITIPRNNNQAQSESNQAQQGSNQVTNQPRSESEQPTSQVTHKINITSPKCEQPTDQVTHKIAPSSSECEQPHIKLSQKQKDIRNFCSVPRTAKEIMDRLGLTDFYNNRKRYIYDLVEAGILERTVPEKPNDPNQKYRLKK